MRNTDNFKTVLLMTVLSAKINNAKISSLLPV